MNFCLSIAGIIALALVQSYRICFLTSFLKGKDLKIKSFFKETKQWVISIGISAVLAAITVVLLYAFKIPGYFIQVGDMLIALVIISVIDVKSHKIHNSMNLLLLISQIISIICVSGVYPNIWGILLSAIILVVLMLISKISKEQIGMGDVKLIVAINLIYGLSFAIYSMLIALIVMLLSVIPLMIMKRVGLKSQIPFAPFFSVGAITYLTLGILL